MLVKLTDHRHNLRGGVLEKMKGFQHAYDKGQMVGKVEAKLKVTAHIGNTRNWSRWHI
jgi:hypothetical protein